MNKIQLALVLVNYNNSNDTIESFIKAKKSRLSNVEISYFIVDNGSSENEKNILHEFALSFCSAENNLRNLSFSTPDIPVIHNEKINRNLIGKYNFLFLRNNLGFSAGNNAILQLGSDTNLFSLFLLLNTDCFVFKNTIQRIVDRYIIASCTFPLQKIGPIGGTLYYPGDGFKIQAIAGGKINKFLYNSEHYFYKKSINPKMISEIYDPDFITGALMLMSKHLIKDIGLLNADFFLYQEDKEYCLRARNYGYKLFHAPMAIAIHKEGGSKKSSYYSYYYSTRNNFYIIKIFAMKFVGLRIFCYFLFNFLSSFLVRRDYIHIKISIIAFYHFILNRMGKVSNDFWKV